MNLMEILGWNETRDQLSISHCVHWYKNVLGREDSLVMSQWKAEIKKIWKKQVEIECMKVDLSKVDTPFFTKVYCRW